MNMRSDFMKRHLIVFTRFPVPGRAKTRLIPALGETGAARLQETMTGHSVFVARCFSVSRSAGAEIRFADGRPNDMIRWLGRGLLMRAQGSGDLGERMERAVRKARNEGAGSVVLIGSDCPGVTVEILDEAFTRLEDHDLVLGPAHDGGYYLIGLRVRAPSLFEGISWGENKVLSETVEKSERLGLTLAMLPSLTDVDRPGDLSTWNRFLETKRALDRDSISIIIPALNEEALLHGTIRRASAGADEIIVVDGGSSDGTLKRAEEAGARVISFPFGRGAQMNRGAAAARGGIFLFLHADSILPEGYAALVRRGLQAPGTMAGAFSLGIDSPGMKHRWVEAAAGGRSRFLHMPYGDQAFFIRDVDFWRMGGFSHLAIMEDFEFARRLGRKGRIHILGQKVVTSGRRWETLGVLRTTLINQGMVVAFLLGLSSGRLVRWYRRSHKTT